MAILRKPTPQVPLVVSVTGVRLGQRVLVVPGRDRQVLFDLASRVGLTGRTLALAEGNAAPLRTATEQAGIVADVDVLSEPLPVGDESFDIAVIDDRTARAAEHATDALLPSVFQALRPGGRVVILLPTGEGIVARLLGRTSAPPAAQATLASLDRAGFRTGRVVAVHDGVGYLEATRAAAS